MRGTHPGITRKIIHAKTQMSQTELHTLGKGLNNYCFPVGSYGEVYRTDLGTLVVDISFPESSDINVVLLIKDHITQTVWQR